MSNITLFIEDKIRDEQIRVKLNGNRSIEQIVNRLVELFCLPRCTFNLNPIEYRLARAVDGTYLRRDSTLTEARIAEGELLQLVSPEGRKVWQTVQKILDKIESEITDKITGELKDQVVEELWNRVTLHLADLEKTRTGGGRIERIRQWVDKIGGPTKLVDIGEDIVDVAELYSGSTASSGGFLGGLFKVGLTVVSVGGVLALITVGGMLLYSLIFPDVGGPFPLSRATAPPAARVLPAEPAPSATDRGSDLQPVKPPSNVEQDDDDDGLTNGHENEIGTNPRNKDTDGDELTDGREVLEIGTNPLEADTDMDELSDGVEVLELNTNPLDPLDPPRAAPNSNRPDELFVTLGGGPFDDRRVSEAVAIAVAWSDLTEQVLPNYRVVIGLWDEDRITDDAVELLLDPDFARQMLAEAGYFNGFELMLIVPAGEDKQLAAVAEPAAEMLAEVGIRTEFVVVHASEAEQIMAENIAAGEAVIGLSR